MIKLIKTALVLLAALAAVPAAAQELPQSIREAAIATRSDTTGRIAGARIGDSNLYVVYIQTARGCGSGGCRAQIWKLDGAQPVRMESLAVGRPSIVVLPQTDNGMPRLGVLTTDENGRSAILPVAFDGENYVVDMCDAMVAPTSGRPLLTAAMLRTF